MSDYVKAILKSPAVWSALFTAIIATILAVKPDFPRELIVVWLGVASAILAAVGIGGVNGVIPDVRQTRARQTYPPDSRANG
jgi:uncharacterized membrane protein YccC